MNASCFGRFSASASDPAEFTMPATSMLSLIRTGMPCSGPRTLPAFRSASSASASASAAGLTLDHRVQPRPGIVHLAMRSRYASVSAREVSVPGGHPIARIGGAQLDDVDRHRRLRRGGG